MITSKNHTLLSASSVNRWLNAPQLPLLKQYFPHTSSSAALALGEYKIHYLLGDQFKRPTSDYQSDEMESLTDDYTSYVMDQSSQAKEYAPDATRVEQKLDFSKYSPEGFGTCDCSIVSDNLLHIIDFKYGKGVRVEAKNNHQMKRYTIGALQMFSNLYNVDEVETTIFKPRMVNISTWTINAKELMHWTYSELKEKAELAFAGQGTVHYGPWYQFSACNALLRARYDYHHKLTRFQLRSPNLLTDSEVTEVLEHIDDLNRWSHEVKDYAADLAINHGKQWPGYKTVEERSIRHYKDEAAVAKIAEANGYHNIYQKKLLPITKLEKQLGKKKFTELFNQEIIKPMSKPTLVPDSDRCQSIGKSNPKDEFKEEQ